MKATRHTPQHGQAMIESLLVVLLAVLCFLIIFQYGYGVSSKLILTHAAARAARARTVGLNEFMVEKTARAGMIPIAGKRLQPEGLFLDAATLRAIGDLTPGQAIDMVTRGQANRNLSQLEVARVPDYLTAENDATASGFLDYEGWNDLESTISEGTLADGDTIRVTLSYHVPAFIPGLGRPAPGGAGKTIIPITAFYEIENHYSLYLQGTEW